MATTLLSGQKQPDEGSGYVPLSSRTYTQAKNVNEANLFYQQKRREAEINKQVEAKKKELTVDTSQYDLQIQAIDQAKAKEAKNVPSKDVGRVYANTGSTTMAMVARGGGWNVGGVSFSRVEAHDSIKKKGYFDFLGFRYTAANEYLIDQKYGGWTTAPDGRVTIQDPNAYTLAMAQYEQTLAALDQQKATVLGQKSTALNQTAVNTQNELARQEQIKNANKVGNAQSGQGLQTTVVQQTNPYTTPTTQNTLLTGQK